MNATSRDSGSVRGWVDGAVRSLCLAALVAAVGATALLAPARAEFGEPFWISQANKSATDPDLAVDADGGAVFVWKHNPGSTTDYRVKARRRSAAGVLGPILDVSDPGEDALGSPRVAIDADGDAVFVWKYSDGASIWIEARTLSAAGVLGSILSLSEVGEDFEQPQLAIDATGDTVFVWSRADQTALRAEARTLSAAGVLGAVLTVSDDAQGSAWRPQVGISADGDAVLAWQVTDNRIVARTLSAAGVLGPILRLADESTQGFGLAVDADGDAAFVLEREVRGHDRIQGRTLTASGERGPILNLSRARRPAYDPIVAVDADGDAIFTWRRQVGGRHRYQARTLSTAGVLGPTINLSRVGDLDYEAIAVDADGDALFAWAHRLFGEQRFWVETRSLSAAGVLGPIQQLSKTGNESILVRIATTADGKRAVAVWQTWPGRGEPEFRIQAAVGP